MITNPTNEHREQAREIMCGPRKENQSAWLLQGDLVDVHERIAAALSSRDTEIREVLEGLAIRRHTDHRSWCWCQKRWDALKPHNENCQRARDLWAKLQPGK